MEKQEIFPVFFDDERDKLFTSDAIKAVLGDGDYQTFSKVTDEVDKLARELAKSEGKEFSKLLVNEAFELQDRAKLIFFKDHPYLIPVIFSCERRLKEMSEMVSSLEEQTPAPPMYKKTVKKSKGK